MEMSQSKIDQKSDFLPFSQKIKIFSKMWY